MGALINVIKSIFGGIFGFITGLLPGKKDSTGTKAVKAAKPKKGKDGFYMVAADDQLELLPAETVTAAVGTIVESGVARPVAATSAAPSAKGGKKEKAKANPLAVKAEPKPTALPSTDELIAAALAAVAKPPAGTESEVLQEVTMGFAERNMIPTLTTGRRRPGPSLSPFKAMGKEIRG